MQQQTELKQEALLKEQTSANENHNSNSTSEPLLTREEVDGTPFHIAGNEEQGYAVTFGKYRLSELRKTQEEALSELIDQHWNITARLAGVIAEHTVIHGPTNDTKK